MVLGDFANNILEKFTEQLHKAENKQWIHTKVLGPVATYIEEYLKIGEEIEIFDGKEDLINKIAKYMADEEKREKIAESGYKRTTQNHTYKQRLRDILKKISYENQEKQVR